MNPASMRVLVGLVLVALYVVLLTDVAPRRDLDAEQRAVTLATLPCDTNVQSTSSGFLVDDRTVVTVAHAIYETQDFAVRDRSGSWHRASVLQLDLGRDLAVLRVDGLRAVPLQLSRAGADDPVRMVAGAASGTATGSVIRPVNLRTTVIGGDEQSVRRGYELALEIGPGDSGAAVVDDDGRVVGVVFGRSTRREGVTWATASDELATLRGLGDVPAWECDDTVRAELDLRPPVRERLAG